jgi:hypothetical protein
MQLRAVWTSGAVRRLVVSLLVVATVRPASAQVASNLVSRPVGIVRLSIPSNAYVLAAMPSIPFDPDINSVLAD